MLTILLAHLVTQGALPAADILGGLSSSAESFEGLRRATHDLRP